MIKPHGNRGRRVGKALLNSRKTECFRGHPLDWSNVYRWTDRRGFQHRSCRTCRRIRETLTTKGETK